MRILFILFLSAVLLQSCETTVESTLETDDSDSTSLLPTEDNSEFVQLNTDTADDSIEYHLRVEKTSESAFDFIIEFKLLGESWIVSPLEVDYPFGPMKLEFDSKEFIAPLGEIKEHPESKLYDDPNWDKPCRVLSGKTSLIQSMEIVGQDDFVAHGSLFFVHEPVCTVYQLGFEITSKSGELSVVETLVTERNSSFLYLVDSIP